MRSDRAGGDGCVEVGAAMILGGMVVLILVSVIVVVLFGVGLYLIGEVERHL